MNLLGARIYDPAVAVSKATSALLAMTAFDTTNLRLTVTVPAHGMIRFRLRTNLSGATTFPQVLLGVLNGATVVGRQVPMAAIPGTALATTNVPLDAEFTAVGLTPGSTSFDAAYGVETVIAATNIHYGGPNNTTGNDAWGAFVFEAWDPQPLKIALDGGVNVTQFGGTNATTSAGRPEVNTTHAAGTAWGSGAITAASIAADAITAAKIADGAIDAATLASGTITAAKFAAGAIDAAAIADNAIDAGAIATGAITAAKFAAGAIDAAAIAADAIGSSEFAQTAADKIWATTTRQLTGTQSFNLTGSITGSLSGSVGSVAGAVGSVTGLTASNLDATISSRLASASYIAPDNASITLILADTDNLQTRIPAALVSGRMDASVGAMAADTLTATALAASAVTEIQAGLSTLDAAGVRSAVGLASANLDTQLAALPTAAEIVAEQLTTVITEAYRANGSAPTLAQFMSEVLAHLGEAAIVGYTKTINKLDHVTPAETYTLDSATAPTSIQRAT